MSKETAQSNFDEAVKAILEKNFSRAKDILLNLQKSGIDSTDIQANLGRTYFELNDYGNAVWHLENSISLDRLDWSLRRELKLAQSKVAGGFGERVSHPSEWAHSVASFVRPLEFASLASIFLLTALFFKIFNQSKRHISLLLVTAVLLIVCFSLSTTSASLALLLNTETPLKSTPLESAEATNTLSSGTRVRIIRESGNFAEIERPGQFRGWVSKDALTRLPF